MNRWIQCGQDFFVCNCFVKEFLVEADHVVYLLLHFRCDLKFYFRLESNLGKLRTCPLSVRFQLYLRENGQSRFFTIHIQNDVDCVANREYRTVVVSLTYFRTFQSHIARWLALLQMHSLVVDYERNQKFIYPNSVFVRHFPFAAVEITVLSVRIFEMDSFECILRRQSARYLNDQRIPIYLSVHCASKVLYYYRPSQMLVVYLKWHCVMFTGCPLVTVSQA